MPIAASHTHLDKGEHIPVATMRKKYTPGVSHYHANTITFVHTQPYKPSGQSPYVAVKLIKVPSQMSLYTHVLRQRPAMGPRTLLSAYKSRVVRSPREYLGGEIFRKSAVVE
jgi:hypothetical protein